MILWLSITGLSVCEYHRICLLLVYQRAYFVGPNFLQHKIQKTGLWTKEGKWWSDDILRELETNIHQFWEWRHYLFGRSLITTDIFKTYEENREDKHGQWFLPILHKCPIGFLKRVELCKYVSDLISLCFSKSNLHFLPVLLRGFRALCFLHGERTSWAF